MCLGKELFHPYSRMDIVFKQESESDVEIVDPEVLEDQFHTQQLRLITSLSQCHKIPKKWTDFEIFVSKTLKFQLSNDLVRTVWTKLCTAENKTGSTCNIVEISDGEEDTKQPDKLCGVFNLTKTENYAWNIGQSSSNLGIIEISDEEAEYNHYSKETLVHLAENGCTKVENTPIPSLERSFCLPNARKRTQKAKRCSLPAVISEQQAEELREQLLLDKIIELELPQVIKGFIKNNNLNVCAKKKKKSYKKKVVNSEILQVGSCPSKVLPCSLEKPVTEI